jgi:hypothetical protein
MSFGSLVPSSFYPLSCLTARSLLLPQNGEVVEVLYLRRQTVKGSRSGVSLTLPPGARNALTRFIGWKQEAGERLNKTAPLFVSRQSERLRIGD